MTLPDISEKKRAVLDQIRVAFDSVPYPGDERITSHPCSECAEVSLALAGKDWRKFLFEPYQVFGYFRPRQPEIKISRDFLSLVTVEALHYFLPLILSAIVVDHREADLMIDSAAHLFDPGPLGKDLGLWEWSEKRSRTLLKAMSPQQRSATIASFSCLPPEYLDPDASVPPTVSDAIKNLESGEPLAWKGKTDGTSGT